MAAGFDEEAPNYAKSFRGKTARQFEEGSISLAGREAEFWCSSKSFLWISSFKMPFGENCDHKPL
jgi:hypothetical protein